LIGLPENPPAFPIEQVFEVCGQTLVIPDEPVQVTTNPVNSENRRRMEVIPPVSLDFVSDIALLAPGTSHPVEVEMLASRADLTGILRLDAPDGWNVSPATNHSILNPLASGHSLNSPSLRRRTTTAKILADAEIGGVHYRNQRVEINYPHIPPQLLQPLANLKALSLELATRGHAVGYLPGAGDSVAENLKQLGYSVKMLDETNLTPEQLRGLDAVVIGVRAFNVRDNIASQLPVLFA
jgi:hypothetical protein